MKFNQESSKAPTREARQLISPKINKWMELQKGLTENSRRIMMVARGTG